MDEIEKMQRQVAATGGLAGVLEAAWDALTVIESACWEYQTRAPELFAAFIFAGSAATQARMALVSAPSLPAGPVEQASDAPFTLQEDVGAVADALASLAGALAGRLAAAGQDAADPADRKACEEAAASAERAVRLLERGER